jgi:AcrR family transcriptional regulator
MGWAERAAERSPVVQRSRSRGVQQAKSIVQAARRLIDVKGPSFTTQELVKEAGIALQTFYRYFQGKDQLILAVIEDIIDESCVRYREGARKLSDPVARLRFYVASIVAGVEHSGGSGKGPGFITAEHWRLQTLYPKDVSRATRPFTDLVLGEITEATEAGQLHPADPEYAAWLMTQLVMAVYHHYDSSGLDEPADLIAERLWVFCLAALGGQATGQPARPTTRTRRTAKSP